MFDFPYNFVMPKLLDFFILLLTFLGSILDLDTVVMCNVVIVYTAVMYVNVVIARVCVLLITLRTNIPLMMIMIIITDIYKAPFLSRAHNVLHTPTSTIHNAHETIASNHV